MIMNAPPDINSQIYRGVWINWERSSPLSQTLTIPDEGGYVLAAFTGSLMSFVGARFWRIVCVFCHRLYSTSEPSSTLHNQRQIILRNAATPESGLWSLLFLSFAWRRHAKWQDVLYILLPLFALALFTTATFTSAAMILQKLAEIEKTPVLLKDQDCGIRMPVDGFPENEDLVEQAAAINDALNYAQQCYSDSKGFFKCGRFKQPRLKITQTRGAPCPFSEGMCRTGDNVRFDSGPINTATDLGLVTPPDQRFTIRYVLHCAPLTTDGFSSDYPSRLDPERNMVQYSYGARKEPNTAQVDWTYQTADRVAQYRLQPNRGDSLTSGLNFRLLNLNTITAGGRPDMNLSSWLPIGNLSRDDGDLNISFLSGNGVVFEQPLDDDWYRATFRTERAVSPLEKPMWLPEETASPLGCVEQFQFCKAASGGGGESPESLCGPVASYQDARDQADQLFDPGRERPGGAPTTRDGAQFQWVADLVGRGHKIFPVLDFLGSRALESQNLLYDGRQGYIPRPDADTDSLEINYANGSSDPAATDGGGPVVTPQWQRDVRHWFSILQSLLQAKFASAPTGPLTQGGAAVRRGPRDGFERELCRRQAIKNAHYTSFTLFSLCFTYAASACIVAASYALEPALRRWRGRDYATAEWQACGALQLHRLAQEEAGYGGRWVRCADEIPITVGGGGDGKGGSGGSSAAAAATLGPLDTTDCDHPMIRRAQGGMRDINGARNLVDDSGEHLDTQDAAPDMRHESRDPGSGETERGEDGDADGISGDSRRYKLSEQEGAQQVRRYL